ncbi:MAG: type VII secretion integral membrane protein EccD [Actinomycetes bacterium]
MSQAMTEVAGLVRVTVVRRDRRADLALPGTLAVADLLPELAEAVGALDAYTVHGGYRLVRPDGVVLTPQTGLTAQGVQDGAVLALEVGVDDEPGRIYDDVVEAVADTVEAQSRPWDTAASRRTGMAAAGLLFVVAALALGLQYRSGLPVAVAAGTLAVLLLAGATVMSRAQRVHDAALVLAWLVFPNAAVAGVAAVSQQSLLQLPLALAGGAVMVTGALGMLALVEHRAGLLPGVTLGGAAASGGAALTVTGLGPAPVFAVVLAVGVIAGSLVPWVALSATRVRVAAFTSDAEITAEPDAIDRSDVEAQVRQGREAFVAMSLTLGLLVFFSAPLVVALGVPGALLGVCACGVLMLRTRQYRGRAEVLAGMVSGVTGLVVLAASAALLHPDWRIVLTAVLVVVGAALLLVAAVPRRASVRLGRLGDIAEGVSLIAILPLLVLAIGLTDVVRT